MRSRYPTQEASFTGGINQDAEAADFSSEADDARNVWTPAGNVEVRPGSEFMFPMLGWISAGVAGDTATQMYKETSAGATTNNVAGVLTLDSLAVGGRIYLGWSTITTGGDQIAAIEITNTLNSNDTHLGIQ